MVAWSEMMKWKTPRSMRRLVGLAKKLSTALSQASLLDSRVRVSPLGCARLHKGFGTSSLYYSPPKLLADILNQLLAMSAGRFDV